MLSSLLLIAFASCCPQEQRPVASAGLATATDTQGTELGKTMRLIADGERVRARDNESETPTDLAAARSDGRDQAAVRLFALAAANGTTGSEAVAALAVSTPRREVRRRALLGLQEAWEGKIVPSERASAVLLHIADRGSDADSGLATKLLAMQLRNGQRALLPQLVQQVNAEWPTDLTEFRPVDPLAPRAGLQFGYGSGNRISRLVLLAMHSGDGALVDRLVTPLPAGSDPNDVGIHARFLLQGFTVAAPFVDSAAARKIHSWYMPHADGWANDPVVPTDTWRLGVKTTLVAIYPQLPDELRATYMRNRALMPDIIDKHLGGLPRTR